MSHYYARNSDSEDSCSSCSSGSSFSDIVAKGRGERRTFILKQPKRATTTSTSVGGAAKRFMNKLYTAHNIKSATLVVAEELPSGEPSKEFRYAGKIKFYNPPLKFVRGDQEVEISTKAVVKAIKKKRPRKSAAKKSKLKKRKISAGECRPCNSRQRGFNLF